MHESVQHGVPPQDPPTVIWANHDSLTLVAQFAKECIRDGASRDSEGYSVIAPADPGSHHADGMVLGVGHEFSEVGAVTVGHQITDQSPALVEGHPGPATPVVAGVKKLLRGALAVHRLGIVEGLGPS